MDLLIGFVAGAVVTSIVWFFVARNNRKYIDSVLNLDWDMDNMFLEAKTKLEEFIAKFKK